MRTVQLETTPDQHSVQWELQGETASGKWTGLGAMSESAPVRGPLDLRKMATEELKRSHIRYILVNSPYMQKEFRDHMALWGIELIGAVPGQQLYQILE